MGFRAHIALLLLAAPVAAWADGVGGYIEEDYNHTRTRSTDDLGTRDSTIDQLIQRYRLSLDRSFFPQLRFTGIGSFEQINSWMSGYGASDSWTRTAGAYATLLGGDAFLNGGAAYNYQLAKTSADGNTLVLQEPSFTIGWRPADLPSLSLRVSRQRIYDTFDTQDLATLNALFAAAYRPVRDFSLQYTASYTGADDRVHDTQTDTVTQLFRADWMRASMWSGRASAAAGVGLVDRRTQVVLSGPGGKLITPQQPVAGLFAIERFPATPDLDTLTASPGLIDFPNTTTNTDIDLGYTPRLANDDDARDLGLQFADVLTKVNTLYLFVNQQLPEPIWRSFQFSVWSSIDNLHWTEITSTPQVTFTPILNRFEITIPATAAPYLKLVTHPLDPAVAGTDKRWASIFVTELQPLLVTDVAGSGQWQANTGATANVNFRTLLFTRDLSYDFTGLLSRNAQTGSPTLLTYVISNGLSYSRKLTTALLLSARVARQDMDQSSGHQGVVQYSAGLAANELPTLSHNLVYSGQSTWANNGYSSTQSLSLYNRAAPYRGISLMAGGSYSVGTVPSGQVLRNKSLTVSTSVQPHRTLTLTGAFGHADSLATGGNSPRVSTATNRIDGTLSWAPIQAIYFAGGVTRLIGSRGPITLFNGSASASPFPRGDLQLGISWNETYQQGGAQDGAMTRLWGPTARWTVRPGTILTVSYSVLDNDAPSLRTSDRTFSALLQIAL
jgi:hypothetical protein